MGLFSGGLGAALSIGGSLLGGTKGSGQGVAISQEAIDAAKEASEGARFRPITVATSIGGSQYDPETGAITSQPIGPVADIQRSAFGGAGSMFGQLEDFDPTQRASQIFSEQAALLEPEFARQRTATRDAAFGSGRLGMMIGGEQPEFAGMAARQAEALASLAAGSRQQAFGEAEQLAGLGQSLLQSGYSPAQMEMAMAELGIDAETARSASDVARGNMMLSPYTQAARSADTASTNRADLFGGLASGLMRSGLFGNKAGGTV